MILLTKWDTILNYEKMQTFFEKKNDFQIFEKVGAMYFFSLTNIPLSNYQRADKTITSKRD